VSLAWAITEHLHNQVGCRSLFATHYHELAQLSQTLPNLRNCNVLVREVRGPEIGQRFRKMPEVIDQRPKSLVRLRARGRAEDEGSAEVTRGEWDGPPLASASGERQGAFGQGDILKIREPPLPAAKRL
jgi:hypothetical protein